MASWMFRARRRSVKIVDSDFITRMTLADSRRAGLGAGVETGFDATLGDCAIMDREQRIRERAYHLWIEEGRPDGRQDEHWRQASRQLAADMIGSEDRSANE